MLEPIVVDCDDFSDRWPCLDDLIQLRDRYPNFRITLFTIPERTSPALLRALHTFPWIEIAVHGFCHEPNDEMLYYDLAEMRRRMHRVDFRYFVRGFKPPGWRVNEDVIEVCNNFGMWVALHERDAALAPLCRHGAYLCRNVPTFAHFHSHNVCGNWIHAMLPQLLVHWDTDQVFQTVSESIEASR